MRLTSRLGAVGAWVGIRNRYTDRLYESAKTLGTTPEWMAECRNGLRLTRMNGLRFTRMNALRLTRMNGLRLTRMNGLRQFRLPSQLPARRSRSSRGASSGARLTSA